MATCHCHWHFALVQSDSDWLVFQEASYCWDSYIWVQIHCCLYLCRSIDWSLQYPLLLGCTNLQDKLHVWRQQVHCG
jgi:hypothetical protein